MFPHFDDKRAALSRFHKLLLPGGRLTVFHAAGSAAINEFHRTEVKDPALRGDRLPPLPEFRKLIEEGAWLPLRFEDTDNGFVVLVEKKEASA